MMKKLIVASLMAATALPSVTPAQAQEREGRWERHDAEAQSQAGRNHDRHDSRQEGTRHWQDGQRPAPQTGPAAGRAMAAAPSPPPPNRQEHRDWRDERGDDRHAWREERDGDRREWRDNRRDDGHDWRDNRWREYRDWNRDWRRDRRYDWFSYRKFYGDRFRPAPYYAPRGWHHGYRRFSVGIYLDGLLFGGRYWIADPYRYHLPPVHGPLRWVRYYDDVLLVDIRNGYVVDVIYNFFW